MLSVVLTQAFQDWLDGVKDQRAQVRIAARLRLAEAGNLGDWKSVGGKVSEMRINAGPTGLPIVFHAPGNIVIVMPQVNWSCNHEQNQIKSKATAIRCRPISHRRRGYCGIHDGRS